MTQAELREWAAEMTKGMNLVDMKFYPGNNGEVEEVVLKYHAPSAGPEPLSGGIYTYKTAYEMKESRGWIR